VYKIKSLTPSATDKTSIESHSHQQHQNVAPQPSHSIANIQLKKQGNTGFLDKLKSGIENLSDYSTDDVRVDYNSSKPVKLQLHSYAQGNDIHLGARQEKRIPHESWNVVQRKGRVRATLQMKVLVNVNDDAGLENEASRMGGKTLLIMKQDKSFREKRKKSSPNSVRQRHSIMPILKNLNGRENFSFLPDNISTQVVQGHFYTAIKTSISDEELDKYNWEKFDTENLKNLVSEISHHQGVTEKIEKIIHDRINKHAEYSENYTSSDENHQFLLTKHAAKKHQVAHVQGIILMELEHLDLAYQLDKVPGMKKLLDTVKKGNDNWEREAAPYLRELFLGISEMGLGGVQMGAIDKVGGDVVYGKGTARLTTLQSKYFTSKNPRNMETDITKGIDQLTGGHGEHPEPNSKHEVDAVLDNPELEEKLSDDAVHEIVLTALQAAKEPSAVDKILIAFPHKKIQYRVIINKGKIHGFIKIKINPMSFDLPELHQTKSGDNMKNLFASRGKVLEDIRRLEEKIKNEISLKNIWEGKRSDIHKGVPEEDDSSDDIDIFAM